MMPRVTVLLSLALLLLSSCAGSPPTQFYVLSAVSAPVPSGASAGQDRAVGVGPVEFPEYLDRPQIVTRTSQNQLSLADFDRWAEPLKDNFTQVLAENLSVLLPSQRVSVYPWKRATVLEYQVLVKVLRFDRAEGGASVLQVRWSLLAGEGRKELLARTSTYSEIPSGQDYAASVAAMNQNLSAFSRDVVAAIAQI